VSILDDGPGSYWLNIPGYDFVVLANVSASPLNDVRLELEQGGVMTGGTTPIQRGGYVNDPAHMPGATGPLVISALAPGEVWAVLVPEPGLDPVTGQTTNDNDGIRVEYNGLAYQIADGFSRDMSGGPAAHNAPGEIFLAGDGTSVQFVPGDITGDGVVNAADLLRCTRILLNLEPYDNACDLVDDDTITAGDIVLIQRDALGF
jgi:hypothetical protein